MNCEKIIVLAGGPSSEREISLKSGRAVFKALKAESRNVELVDIAADFPGKMAFPEVCTVFIALHGRFGEDGTVQAMLEESGIPYTGSGVQASRLALDKIASRAMFLKAGINVTKCKIFNKDAKSIDIQNEFDVPFVVKPQSEGSSIGLSIVRNKSQLKDALNEAFKYGEHALLEEYIHGRELTVGILENKALPVIEIVTREEVYDYAAKYKDEGTQYIVPADLGEELRCKAQDAAKSAHNSLGCRDFSRVDMRMDKNGKIFVLEVNTIPGMTERSLLPKAARAAGVDFCRLCMKLVDLANKRGGVKWQEKT